MSSLSTRVISLNCHFGKGISCKVHPRLSTRIFRSKWPILWNQRSPEVHFAKNLKPIFHWTDLHYFWNITSWYYLKQLAGNKFLVFTFLGGYIWNLKSVFNSQFDMYSMHHFHICYKLYMLQSSEVCTWKLVKKIFGS